MVKKREIDKDIFYIPATEEPLSADVGMIEGEQKIWLFDVGNREEVIEYINEQEKDISVIISHFHPDHMGGLSQLTYKELYVGENTYRYTKCGTRVIQDIYLEDGNSFHIFPLPSSHAKGSLGLEVNETYAFLGDATYSTMKKGVRVYNAQLLLEQIRVLSALRAPYVLLSHQEQFIQKRQAVIEELEEIYQRRDKNCPYICV